jgi:hypothetical protein
LFQLGLKLVAFEQAPIHDRARRAAREDIVPVLGCGGLRDLVRMLERGADRRRTGPFYTR